MSRSLPSWLLTALAIASIVVFSTPLASADLIGSAPAPVPADAAVHAPAAATVADALRVQGLSESEVSARIAELQPADMTQLAASPEQLQVAGSGGALVVGAAILGVLLIAAIIYFIG